MCCNIVSIDREQTNALCHDVYDDMSLGSVWDSPNEGKSTEFYIQDITFLLPQVVDQSNNPEEPSVQAV